jgi:hypothetical protein
MENPADSTGNGIEMAFDSKSGDYYAVWQPVFLGSGRNRLEALKDLRKAARFGIDAMIDVRRDHRDNKSPRGYRQIGGHRRGCVSRSMFRPQC